MVTKATHSMKPSVILPAKREGELPAWPLNIVNPDERMWEELWSYPQSIMWEKMRSHRLVARYVLLNSEVEGRGTKFLTEVRSLEDRLGLSPKSLAALRWVIKEEGGPTGPSGDSGTSAAAVVRDRPRVTD